MIAEVTTFCLMKNPAQELRQIGESLLWLTKWSRLDRSKNETGYYQQIRPCNAWDFVEKALNTLRQRAHGLIHCSPVYYKLGVSESSNGILHYEWLSP